MRALMLVLAVIAMVGCKTVPIDNNLATLTASAQAQAITIAATEQARNTAIGEAVSKCAASVNVEGCMLGVAAVFAGGGSGSNQQPVLPNYQRPPTPAEQAGPIIGGIASLVTGVGQVWASVETNKESNRTTRYVAGVNAQRDVAQTQAWSGALTGVTTAVAAIPGSLPPSTQITVGRDYITGNPVTIGGNSSGRDNVGQGANTGTITTTTTTTTGNCQQSTCVPPAAAGGH